MLAAVEIEDTREGLTRDLDRRVRASIGAAPRSGAAHAALLQVALPLVWLWGAWLVLIVVTPSAPVAVALAVIMGLASTNAVLVAHNALHGGLFQTRRANQVAAWLCAGHVLTRAGMIGRHNDVHHAHRDPQALADDLTSTVFRFSPDHPWHPWHRYQHWYVWPAALFEMMLLTLLDVVFVVTGRDGGRSYAAPSLTRTVRLAAEKLAQPIVLLGLPLLLYPPGPVLGLALVALLASGFSFTSAALVGHVVATSDVEGARQRLPSAESEVDAIDDERVRRILHTTSNTATDSLVVSWYLGWAHNHHIEHHLFPDLPVRDLPAAAVAVRATCWARGLPYHEQVSLPAALRAVGTYLRRTGRPPEGAG